MGDDEALADGILATLDAPPDPETLRARAGSLFRDDIADRYLKVMLP